MEIIKEIATLVKEVYDIDCESIVPTKGQYAINSGSNRYLLKKVSLSDEKWMCVDKMKNHLEKNGFFYFDKYVKPVNGAGLFEIYDDKWTLIELPELTECDFEKIQHMELICRQLAKMHIASEGFQYCEEDKMKVEIGSLDIVLEKRLGELIRTKNKAIKNKSDFDIKYLENCDYYIEQGKQAVEILKNGCYKRVCDDVLRKGGFGHLDLSFQNILFNNQDVYIINFESAGVDTNMYDLANLIRRKMRKCAWDVDMAHHMFYNYANINEVSRDEIMVLKAMLMFPQKLWRVINKYYNMKKCWVKKNMSDKLAEATAELDAHENFIKKFLLEYC